MRAITDRTERHRTGAPRRRGEKTAGAGSVGAGTRTSTRAPGYGQVLADGPRQVQATPGGLERVRAGNGVGDIEAAVVGKPCTSRGIAYRYRPKGAGSKAVANSSVT